MNFRDPRDGSKRKSTVDIGALNRDESLVAALGRGDRPHSVNGDPVVDLLYRWRADLDLAGNTIEISAPREPVGAGSAAASPGLSGPSRLFGKVGRRILVAAAITAICVSSVGGIAATTGAQPGSTFWPIAQALNTERARSVQSAAQVTTLLNDADKAVRAGQFSQAADLLTRAQTALADVQQADGAPALKTRLAALWNRLSQSRGDQPNSPGRTTAPGKPGRQPAPNTPGSQPNTTPSGKPGTPSPSGSAAPSSPSSPTPGGSFPPNNGSSGAQTPLVR
jgi:hypothetical protein